RRRHTSSDRDWSSDVCSSDLTDGVVAFQRCTGAEYALFHGHYWLSGLVAVELASRFHGVPVVQMFHTLGVVKNALADSPSDWVRSEERRVGKVWRWPRWLVLD